MSLTRLRLCEHLLHAAVRDQQDMAEMAPIEARRRERTPAQNVGRAAPRLDEIR